MKNNEELQLAFCEKKNSGTTWTKNQEFDKKGYLVIPDLYEAHLLRDCLPAQRGQFNYWSKDPNLFRYEPVENQVEGCVSRYWHPQYRSAHTSIRHRIEKILGRKLYNTYYFDRFYFPGQELRKHLDRDACEISVTLHIHTNIPKDQAKWPIWIKTPDVYNNDEKTKILIPGENHSVLLNPGDGMIYKGCERPHWREKLPEVKCKKKKETEEFYYHQIFFHYVLQDGQRAHCAFDAAK